VEKCGARAGTRRVGKDRHIDTRGLSQSTGSVRGQGGRKGHGREVKQTSADMVSFRPNLHRITQKALKKCTGLGHIPKFQLGRLGRRGEEQGQRETPV
jgi:hypothetical protein